MDYHIKNGETNPILELFDYFVNAGTCKTILYTFQRLCNALDIKRTDHRHFYKLLKSKLTSWKAQSLWAKLDKRASHKEYRKGEACANTRVLIIGSGPCGLRIAIETALLGGKVVLVEKRDRFSRNNVLHLWPFLITDLKNLGAKKFFGKFCAGSIEHISIRQLQCILLKVALIFGVEVHVNCTFEGLQEPSEDQSVGWKCLVCPKDHPVSEFVFDVLIGADGKRNTLSGFKRKEFRGKLAIAITANFINFNTQEEAQAEEISGVAFIYNQKFFHELREKTRIDLENIVYYKDETHYFVMTAKKTSLLEKGVLKHDHSDTGKLLSHENVDHEALLNYAKAAADFSTNYKLPTHEYAVNHYGRADVAMFDFTSLFQAENASRVLERHQHRLLLGLVGDALLEPFWPTGSGCARGFLGAFDAAWMIRRWASGSMTPLQVIAERESIYRLLSQTTPENLKKNFNMYTINPNTRYPDLNLKYFRPDQVRHLYDCGEETFIDEIIEIPAKKARNDDLIDSYTLLCWCQSLLNEGKHKNVNVVDFTFSWKSGLALCALISAFRPDLFDFSTLNEEDFVYNNQLAFGMAEKELGILPVMTGKEMAECEVPDKLTMISYLSQFFEILKKEKPAYSNSLIIPLEEVPKSPLRSPAHRISLLQKFSHRFSKTRRKSKDEEENIQKRRFFGAKRTLDSESQKPVELTHFKKLPITEISNKLTTDYKVEDIKREKKEVQSNINVSAMAELLTNKFKSGFQTPEPPVKRLITTPSLLAAQPASEFCYFCKKRVYIMERMSAEGLFFHRGCLRCDYCKRNLRLGNYAFEKNSPDTAKFYCFRHVGMMKRPRKRGYAEDDDVVKESIEASHQVAESSLIVPPFKQEQEQPVPLPSVGKKILTNVKIPQEIFATAQNTPERIEFENSIAGLTEESEEQQTQHNLQSYLSMETIFLGSDDDDDDSDSESSDEDADDEDADNDTDGEMTWEDVCRIAKSWTRKSLLEQVHSESSSLDENGLETEKEFSSEEVDDIFIGHTPSESEDRSITDVSRVADKQFPARTGTLSPPVLPAPPLRSPLSPSSVMAARANFFASPPEPVRLDAKLVFGMDNTHKLKNSDKEQERKDDATAIMISDQIHESRQRLPSAPETEVLDSVKTTKVVSVEEDEDKENLTKDELIESDTETLEDEQSEDLEFDEQEKANNMEEDDEEFDRLAVSQAMERFLGDINKSDSESDEKIRSRSDAFHQTKEKPFSDSETASTISTESLDTEMAVLQSVAEMVYSDIESNDETLQEVLDSIKATNDMLPDASESTDQNEDKQLWTGIDDRFVTRRKQGTTSFENSFASLDLLSDESFITSEISTSSSLSEAVQYNEQFFQQDENKTDLLKEYEHALREVVNMQLDSQETKDLHLASFTEKDNLTPKRISSGKEEVVCETAVKKENKNLYTTLKNNLDLNYSCKDETHFLKSSSTGVAVGSKGKSSAPLTSLNFPSTVKSLATNSEECGQQRVKTDGVPAEQLKLHPFPRPRRMLPEVKDFRKNLLLPRASHPIPTPRLSKSSNDQPTSPKMGLLVNKTIKDKELKENNLGQTPGVEKIRIPVCNLNIKLDSHIESDKMSSPEVASRKKIPLDVSLLKHEKNPNVGNSVENDIDDIPFADESDSDAFFPSEKFYTQAISVNCNATGSQTLGFRKRILPSIPQTVRSPALPSPDQIQSIQAAEKEKTRLKLTEDAIRVMNPVSDIPANLTLCGWVTERPPASKAGSLKEKSQMFQESHCVLGEPDPPTKKEKKRSLLSMFLPGRSWHKTASSGTGSEKLKLPPTRKENKSSKIGQKDKRQMNSVDGLEQDICDDMKDLNIQSVFYSPYPKPEEDETFSKAGYQFIPPQADLDDFSDSGESFLSTDTTLSKRSRSDPKRIQRAARKQQKRRQQQRLRKAQEIQRHLEEVDVKQKELEERGVLVEKSLRGEGADARRSESELMQEWFNLVHEKNVLVRCESELMVQAKELELEDRQARLEQELREKKNHEEPNESGSQISDDANILKELLEVVEQRNALVAMLDDDRLREQEEDKNLESVMHIKGFQLTSLTS